jgi:cell division protein FtsB
MNKKLTTKKRNWLLLLWPPLVLASVLVIIWSPNGLLDLRQLYAEHRALIQNNLILEKENHRLYDEIGRLRDDPAAIESLARQELGLVKDGELIFHFVSPSPKE